MFTIKDVAKRGGPHIPHRKLKKHILGDSYNLSLVLCDSKFIENLNKRYRNKDKTTNILSFPISKDTGEIFLNVKEIKREAKNNFIPVRKYYARIFIHGLLHLKGYSHSSKMDNEEQKVLGQFGIS